MDQTWGADAMASKGLRGEKSDDESAVTGNEDAGWEDWKMERKRGRTSHGGKCYSTAL